MIPDSSKAPTVSGDAPDSIDCFPAHDGSEHTHPFPSAQERRRDILLGDCAVANAILAAHIDVANTYLGIADVERFRAAMVDVRDRLQIALRKTNQLTEEERSATIAREEAIEYRRDRDCSRPLHRRAA